MSTLSRTRSHPDLSRARVEEAHQSTERLDREAGSSLSNDTVTQRSLIRVESFDRLGLAEAQPKSGPCVRPDTEGRIHQTQDLRVAAQQSSHDSLQNDLLQPENYTYKVHRSESQESSSVNMAVLAGLETKKVGGGEVKNAGQYRWQSSDLMTGRRHWSSAKGT